MVLRIFQGKKTIGEPIGIGPIKCEPDNTSPNTSLNKVVFNKRWNLPDEVREKGGKVLIEF